MRQFIALAAAVSLSALAQAPASYDGKWTVTWQTARGYQHTAELDLSAGGGSYVNTSPGSREEPCLSKAHPVTIEKATEEELVVAINQSQTMAGCPNNRLTLKKTAAARFEGKFAGGTKVVVTPR
jgi:hypothetical protein